MAVHQAGVNGGHFDLERFVALTATNPARLFGLEGVKGSVAVGHDADIVLWDLGREHTITSATNHGATDYTLYEGLKVTGTPVMTLIRGEVVTAYGQLEAAPGSGNYLHRARV